MTTCVRWLNDPSIPRHFNPRGDFNSRTATENDFVPYDEYLDAAKEIDVNTKVTIAIKSMYCSIKACIRYKGITSDFINSTIGVKQGDPSSSLLCLFFPNDIIKCINTDIYGIMTLEELKLFCIVLCRRRCPFCANPRSLQTMLPDFESYCNTWGMKLNVNKTKGMSFTLGRPTSYNFYIYNTLIELVDSFKYLYIFKGVHLFKNNRWNRTQKWIASDAASSLHNLFITLNQLDLKTSHTIKLFDSPS